MHNSASESPPLSKWDRPFKCIRRTIILLTNMVLSAAAAWWYWLGKQHWRGWNRTQPASFIEAAFQKYQEWCLCSRQSTQSRKGWLFLQLWAKKTQTRPQGVFHLKISCCTAVTEQENTLCCAMGRTITFAARMHCWSNPTIFLLNLCVILNLIFRAQENIYFTF